MKVALDFEKPDVAQDSAERHASPDAYWRDGPDAYEWRGAPPGLPFFFLRGKDKRFQENSGEGNIDKLSHVLRGMTIWTCSKSLDPVFLSSNPLF